MDNRERILSAYIDHLREEGRPPESIFRFCRSLEIAEKEFFTHFASFEVVEKIFWQEWLLDIIGRVESGAEYETFDARQRLLTFLFAFHEKSIEVRSLMLMRFKRGDIWIRPVWLKGFEDAYKDFVRRLLDHGRERGEVAARGRLGDLYPEGFYLGLRSIIDFNLRDDSEGFQRTDAFIEKSVNLAFDLVRTQALDSALDLARFLGPDLRRQSAT